MTAGAASELLVSFTTGVETRPIPSALLRARADVRAALDALHGISDARLTAVWPWKGGSEEEVRYAFYRVAESFELAAIEAADALRAGSRERGRAGDLVAPATSARWELDGLLATLGDAVWDAQPGAEEWTIRQTLAHVISSQRAYGLGTAWWLARRYRAGDPALPEFVPEEVWQAMPEEEDESSGSAEEVRARLGELLDETTRHLAGLTPADLAFGARWSGFAVDIGFRLGRWASHLREHTIQVEKTLAMLDHRPREVDRLVHHLHATWGRAESVVYGWAEAEGAIEPLALAAHAARETAADAVAHASGPR